MIQTRITKMLSVALRADTAPLATHYGAIVGIGELGHEARVTHINSHQSVKLIIQLLFSANLCGCELVAVSVVAIFWPSAPYGPRSRYLAVCP